MLKKLQYYIDNEISYFQLNESTFVIKEVGS